MKESIIIDVNIWISYFIKSKATEIVDLIIHNKLIVYSDKNLRNELIEVMCREKFSKYLTAESIENCILIFDGLTKNFNTKNHFTGSPDPKDNYLYDLALQTNSIILVTGDKKLLNFKIPNLDTMSLSDFKNLLK
jgi:uncharacterized protein